MADTATATGGTVLHPLAPLPYRVARAVAECDGVVTLDLEPHAEAIAPPEPGQFCMLYAPAVGEAPISVSGCPREDGVLRHTIRAAGAATRAICALEPGDTIGVRGPYGIGWPDGELTSTDVLVVAGGLGLAPLRPVIRRVLRLDPSSTAVAIGARDPSQLLFRDEYDAWGRSADVAVTVDHAPATWAGEVGVVTGVLRRLVLRPTSTTAFVCGPEVMMRVVARSLVDLGVPAGRVLVSLERNMHCAVGHCGHCQLGPPLLCVDGPVLPWDRVRPLLEVRRW